MPDIIEFGMSTTKLFRFKNIFVLFICILAVFLTLLYTRNKQNGGNTAQNSISVTNTKTPNKLPENSEWKKDFFTGSVTTNKADQKSSKSTNVEKPLTLTDKLGREFFTKYVELKQQNLADDQKTVASAMEQTLANALSDIPQIKKYTLNQLNITNTNDKESIKSYANSIGLVFIELWPTTDPAQITNEAFESGNVKLLKNIEPLTISYDKIVKRLLIIPVPKILASDHLDILNSASSLLNISQGLRSVEADPTKAIIALNDYQNTMDTLKYALINLNTYFKSYGLYFGDSEPGNVFSTI
jgi:hypothetical protein